MADNLTPAQRSYCMSRVRTRDTDIEEIVCSMLRQRGLPFITHDAQLPGKPDVVFTEPKVAVFVDGDFWHGYGFDHWRASLSEFWNVKIERNRQRDRRNSARLKQQGWKVIRVWQHQVEKNPARVVQRIARIVADRSPQNSLEPSAPLPA